MAAAAHNPAFAKKAGVPVSVAKEFNQADKGRKFKGGGMAKKSLKMIFAGKETKAEEKAERAAVGGNKAKYKAAELKYEGKAESMKCGGKVKKMAKGGGVEVRGKTKGKLI